MTVIDVDSHFEPRQFAPGENPLEEFIGAIPVLDLALEAVAGDLWQATPPATREALLASLPMPGGGMGASRELPPAAADVTARLAWMDAVGIDFGLVNPGGGYALCVANSRPFIPDSTDRHRAVRAANDYLAGWLEGHTHRMAPVTLLDYADIDFCVEEMTRMRARGSRAAFLWATPFAGRSPAHPDHDRFWAALTDLGMVGILHIGNTPAHFADGWGDAGWTLPGGGGAGGFLRFANSQRTQAAQTFIAALVFGGVFERNPNATIVLAELWASWLPWFVDRMEMLVEGGGMLGEWTAPMTPAQQLRRNVKVTPLPGLHDDGMAVVAAVPDMLVFSSDFPHNEGNADPIGIYGAKLDGLDPSVRDAFLGGTMADVFARMGDPLPL